MSARLSALLMLLFMLCAVTTAAPAMDLRATPEQPLGRQLWLMQEQGAALDFAQAREALADGRFRPSEASVPSFGIGAEPVWAWLPVSNPSDQPLHRRLTIATAWLDRIDVYLLHQGGLRASHRLGDTLAHGERPVPGRHFAIEHDFPPGEGGVLLRVASPDPLVLPLYLETRRQADRRIQLNAYSYGFMYGFLVALLSYNLMLYAGLRSRRYLLYAVYLGLFILMNMAYTGHGFQWLWPGDTAWAQWSQPVLMMLYASAGLSFALSFLGVRRAFPRLHRALVLYMLLALAALALAVLYGLQREALRLAFAYVTLFTLIMLALGLVSVRARVEAAHYFLLAALTAMSGAGLTALAVWGAIPYNTWTYRAVDTGMLMDAVLLALALTHQFRLGERRRQSAELLAGQDPLTGVDNRRAFYAKSGPLWSQSLRQGSALSVIVLDLDHFKRINDRYGHEVGDEALKLVARTLRERLRGSDLIARWGGEEFILLMPDTDADAALVLAEELRQALIEQPPLLPEMSLILSASFGVAQREPVHRDLAALISAADQRLYRAKALGRNRVVGFDAPETEAEDVAS